MDPEALGIQPATSTDFLHCILTALLQGCVIYVAARKRAAGGVEQETNTGMRHGQA